MKRKRIGLVFGGKSAEHEISVGSARSVYQALNPSKYEVVLIGIDKAGHWRILEKEDFLTERKGAMRDSVPQSGDCVVLVPEAGVGKIVSVATGRSIDLLELIFPVLHGPYGEDGTIQGLLKLAGIPFVGAGVLASAIGMDKDVTKRLLRDAQIPVAKFCTFREDEVDFVKVKLEIGLPVFVKPANLGSSVGISRATDDDSFREAVVKAFKYDQKIVVEQALNGREVECSVLGNEKPVASLPGEVVPNPRYGFYSYEAKYLDAAGAQLKYPADLPSGVTDEVQRLAVKAYQTLCCEGMARVDFFIVEKPHGRSEVFVNELNTIPGFTSISMYPKLWEVSGLPYSALIDRLIELAFERHRRENLLDSSAFD